MTTYNSTREQIWPCRKIGQGQPRVIIWTNSVLLMHLMLHTKFQGHRPFGPGEEDFLRFLPYMGMAAVLVMWPEPFERTFVPPSRRGSIWNLASIDPVVSVEKMFDQRTSGPVNAHLTSGPGIYFTAFIHVYNPRAGADNPLGTNVDVNRKPVCCKF